MADLLSSIVGAAAVDVETSLSPRVHLTTAGPSSRLSSLLLKVLRPKVTVFYGGAELATVAPEGDPAELRPYVLAGAAVLIGAAVLAVAVSLSKD